MRADNWYEVTGTNDISCPCRAAVIVCWAGRRIIELSQARESASVAKLQHIDSDA